MNPNAMNNHFFGEQAALERIMQMNNRAAAQEIMQVNNRPMPWQLMQMNNQLTPWPQMQMNNPLMPWQLMPMNNQTTPQPQMPMNNQPTPWPQMQMNNPLLPWQQMPLNNQAAAHQLMQMNDQVAEEQLMQMNNQAAAEQLMQMNDQVADEQFMQMNTQAAAEQLMQMNDQAAEEQFMQMNNQAAAEQLMQMNDQVAEEQLMQMNNQAAAEQLMQMNDQVAEEQFMQMNTQAAAEQLNNQPPPWQPMPMYNQPTPWQLMEMNDMMKMAVEEETSNMVSDIKRRNADVPRYRPLYKAIREKKWKAVENFVNNDPEALDDDITEFGDNIFHLLIPFEEAIGLLEKFVSIVTPESLERVNIQGSTALITAAVSGNTKGAKVLVDKNKNLLSLKQRTKKFLPIHAAAYCSRKETVEYLLSETVKVIDLTDKNGALLLKILIKSNLFGTALYLLKQYPELALAGDDRNPHWKSNFSRMARKPLLFASGTRLGFWQSFVYHCIPLQEENHYPLPEKVAENREKPTEISESSSATEPFGFQQIRATFGELLHKLNIIFWNTLMQLAPSIKRIHDKKLMHAQTLEIVKMMIGDYSNWNYEKASDYLKESVFSAASLGIYEVVNEVLKAYNVAASFEDHIGHTILSLAVFKRQEKIFNLVYQVSDPTIRDQITISKNFLGLTILHVAGMSAPSSEVPGAALQMQRELQWFKTVENLFHPSLQGKHDGAGKTPKELFTETHGALVDKGEKWMKDTATSCSVVAALIITVVFAAAFTVPGGLDNNGRPIFFHDLSFKIFAISVALALFSSTASVQMFLGILTSRYAEEDFLFSLPKKLMTGLIALFFSIASMMVAFAATFSIVISHPWRWVTFLIASLGAVPVTLFAWMQFPLLVDIYKYTYGAGIYKPMKIKDVYM